RRGNALCATASDLRGLGFVLPPGEDERCLPDISGLHYIYDVKQQRVTVDAPLDQLNLPRQILNKAERSATPPTSGTGVLLNYDLYAAEGGGLGNVSALTELRAFSEGLGVLSST
ncbi:hypothetical protein CBX98_25380, partial [Vibrio sp. T9]|uniref:hypothetical protein n=1 Tax=Vibrio sp. T9 TaxID=2007196 RepID=UPI000D66B481